MLNKKIKSFIAISSISLMLFTVGCTNTESPNIEDIQDTKIETNETAVKKENLEIVKQSVEEMVEGVEEFEVSIVGKDVMLVYYQEEGTTEYAINNGEWEELVESGMKISNNVINAIKEAGEGFENINFKLCYKEDEKDNLIIYNNQIVYNQADYNEIETILIELDTNKQYNKINTRNDLEKYLEGDNVELLGKVWGKTKNGTMGIKFQLDTDEEEGYSIEVNSPSEGMEDLKEGDVVRVQGVHRGIQSWSLNEKGENYGAYQINAMNIYVIEK